MAMGISLAFVVLAGVLVLRVGSVAVLSPTSLLRMWMEYRIEQAKPEADHQRELVRASWNDSDAPPWAGSHEYSTRFEGFYFDLGVAGFYYEALNCTGITELAWGKVASVEGALVRLDVQQDLIAERSPFGFDTEVRIVPGAISVSSSGTRSWRGSVLIPQPAARTR